MYIQCKYYLFNNIYHTIKIFLFKNNDREIGKNIKKTTFKNTFFNFYSFTRIMLYDVQNN